MKNKIERKVKIDSGKMNGINEATQFRVVYGASQLMIGFLTDEGSTDLLAFEQKEYGFDLYDCHYSNTLNKNGLREITRDKMHYKFRKH